MPFKPFFCFFTKEGLQSAMRSFLFYHLNFCLRKTLTSISFQKSCNLFSHGDPAAICYSAARVVYSYFCPFICFVFPFVHFSLKINRNLSVCDESQAPDSVCSENMLFVGGVGVGAEGEGRKPTCWFSKGRRSF